MRKETNEVAGRTVLVARDGEGGAGDGAKRTVLVARDGGEAAGGTAKRTVLVARDGEGGAGDEAKRTVLVARDGERPLLTIEHLRKSYGDTVVLRDINISVSQGEVIVVVGPSGCGKSTLLRCINALEPIQGGSIRLEGKEIGGSEREVMELRQKVGMVFQSYDLFPHMSVMDNITLAPIKALKVNKHIAEAEAQALLSRVGLEKRGDALPRELSGGQKQRVAIARALAMHPEMLLLDEITAALDPEMVREVLDVILDLAKEGKTMIIVTHEMQFARAVADRVVFIDDGVIVEEDIPERFFKAPKTERAQRFLHTFEFDAVRHHEAW